MSEVNYQAMYDEYWNRPDRKGQDAYDEDLEGLKHNVLALCKSSSVLDVGCGMGKFVRALLDVGVDAHGVDVSSVAVEMGNDWGPGRFTLGSLTDRLPFDDSEFDTVVCTDVLEHIHEDHVRLALSELRRVTATHLFVTLSTTQDRDDIWHLTVRDRAWWHDQFLQAGMRAHPLSSQVYSSKAWRTEAWRATFLLEKIPDSALATDPLDALRAERDLHMDMTREVGSRADAHVERYNVAASLVREGDVVLDAACGLGYGAKTIHAFGRAKEVVGVDLSEGSVAYANRQFASGDGSLRFEAVDLGGPLPYADGSFDVVASFETLEHLRDPELFLSEVNRILRPGGRVIVSVPNDWTDETGNDPNPYHFHVYDWHKVRDQIASQFMVDMAYSQIAGGGMKLTQHPRSLTRVAPDVVPSIDAEWWLLVGVKSPLSCENVQYTDHSFAPFPDENLPVIVDFTKFYENPWLVKSLVVMGWRVNNPSELKFIVDSTLSSGNPASADWGGALCVLSYMLLTAMPDVGEVENHTSKIDDYLSKTEGSANPHVRRWRVSLLYVAGRLHGAAGQFGAAVDKYKKCVSLGATLPFPLLATKTCDAYRRMGIIALARGDSDAAMGHFGSGIEHAMVALRSVDLHETWGYPNNYLIFGFDEVSEIVGIAKRCSELMHELRKKGHNATRYGLPDFRYSANDPTVSELIHNVRTLRSDLARVSYVADERQKVIFGVSKRNRGPIRRALSRWAKSLRKLVKRLN